MSSDRAHRDALVRKEEERRERYELVRLKRDAEFEERLKKAKEYVAGRLVLPLKLVDYDFVGTSLPFIGVFIQPSLRRAERCTEF